MAIKENIPLQISITNPKKGSFLKVDEGKDGNPICIAWNPDRSLVTDLNADRLDSYHATDFEMNLQQPAASGYVLTSTAGVRSWVAPESVASSAPSSLVKDGTVVVGVTCSPDGHIYWGVLGVGTLGLLCSAAGFYMDQWDGADWVRISTIVEL